MSDHTSTPSRPGSPVGELPNFAPARAFRFTWDPATRKSGPGSISETTEGRGDYFTSNVQYDALHSSAASLPLGSLPPEWSSSTHGFHAISTVVNNPHKRSAPPKAHSSLPSVLPADLPRVRRKDFNPYLHTVAPEWDHFEHSAQQGREGAAQIDATITDEHPSLDADLPMTPRTPRPPPGRALPPLDSVPAVFFDSNFNLGDPRTFHAVTEQPEGEEDWSDPSALSHSLPLLEKMSHHADTIEQHLVREISIRSTSFFAALSNLQDLQTESEQCLNRLTHMRTLLKEVDDKGAKKGLEVVRMESKLRNIGAAREGVKIVSGVVDLTNVAKSLVAAGQWGEALDIVDELDALWTNGAVADAPKAKLSPVQSGSSKGGRVSPLPTVPESPPGSPTSHTPKKPDMKIPVSSLQAFASLPTHLKDLTMEITSSLTSDLVNVLRLDLSERADADDDTLSRMDVNMSLKDRLRPMLQCLVRTNGIHEATLSWREVAMGEVRSALKRRIPSIDLDDDDPKSSPNPNLAEEFQSKDHEAFLSLARAMYKSLLNCLTGLQIEGNIVVEVLQGIPSPKTHIDIPTLQEDLSDLLSSAAELANARASKIVALRAEQHAILDLHDFWGFFKESWDFVVKSEIICRRMIVGLRGTIVSQAKTFLQTFHQARLSQSAKLVEDELWNPAEVSPEVQRIVDMLVDASIHDPPPLLFDSPIEPEPSPLPPGSPLPSASLTVNDAVLRPSSPLPSPAIPRTNGSSPRKTHSPGKHLRIEYRAYFAVSATLEVLVLLVDYLKVIMNVPMLTMDTMSRVIELLKSFNSRTCQVVLGAGAMRSAGLKNITAKHLALASQSLSIMISLIPYVRETFRRHINQKQAVLLVEFDKLKRDYQEHQNEIHAKLIAIMGDRLSAHIRSLQTVQWDGPPAPSGVNDYMEVLVKETVTLHKVLSRYLNASVVEYVMTQVFAAINHRLSEEYTKIDLPSQEAKDRLLADAKFLHQKLSVLKNAGAPTAMLETVISEKSVPRKVTQSANQRIKGMLGRTDSMLNKRVPPTPAPDVEKALPLPIPTTTASLSPSLRPPPLPIPGSRPGSPLLNAVIFTSNGLVGSPPPDTTSFPSFESRPTDQDEGVDDAAPRTPPKSDARTAPPSEEAHSTQNGNAGAGEARSGSALENGTPVS